MLDYIVANLHEDEVIYGITECLKQNNKTVSVMEDCTGGAVLSYLATYLQDDLICGIYSPTDKIKMIDGVRDSVINADTVNTKILAQEMCETQLQKYKSDIAIAVTGYVGGEDKDKDVAAAYICIEDSSGRCEFQPVYIEHSPIGMSIKQQQDYIKRIVILVLESYLKEVLNLSSVSGWGN